jgi:hypothetical protein
MFFLVGRVLRTVGFSTSDTVSAQFVPNNHLRGVWYRRQKQELLAWSDRNLKPRRYDII